MQESEQWRDITNARPSRRWHYEISSRGRIRRWTYPSQDSHRFREYVPVAGAENWYRQCDGVTIEANYLVSVPIECDEGIVRRRKGRELVREYFPPSGAQLDYERRTDEFWGAVRHLAFAQH